jgi:hypothetical protein
MGEKNSEGVPCFTCSGAQKNRNVTGQSIRERMQGGNWTYCADLYLFKNQIVG